jgi:hypothetical protein
MEPEWSFLMNAAAFVVVLSTAAGGDIQGTWAGTGRDARFTLVFCEDVLAIRVGTDPILETRESHFSVNAELGTIDILRDDGLQMGRFAIEDGYLTMILADVNLPRPASIDFPILKPAPRTIHIDRRTWKPPTQRRYVFERAH